MTAGHTEKSKPRFWGNPTQKPRAKKIFLEYILRPIQKDVSWLPNHFEIGVKMTSKNIFFTLGFLRGVAPESGFWFFCELWLIRVGHVSSRIQSCRGARNATLRRRSKANGRGCRSKIKKTKRMKFLPSQV